jgi:pyruvate formate lyase activating enzyme
LESIARKLTEVDSTIPFTTLAFFPEYQMKDFAMPSVIEMVEAYQRVKATSLQHIHLGNVGIFARTEEDRQYLMAYVDREGF